MIVALAILLVAGLQVQAQETCIHEDGTTGEIKRFERYYTYEDQYHNTHTCTLYVKVCVTCSVVQGQFKIELKGLESSEGCTITQQAYNDLLQLLCSEEGYREYCGSDIPPCPETAKYVVVEPICLVRTIAIIGHFPDDYETKEVFFLCEDTPYCVYSYERCYNVETRQYELRNETFTVVGGEPTCPPNDWENPVYDVCLKFRTNCK